MTALAASRDAYNQGALMPGCHGWSRDLAWEEAGGEDRRPS